MSLCRARNNQNIEAYVLISLRAAAQQERLFTGDTNRALQYDIIFMAYKCVILSRREEGIVMTEVVFDIDIYLFSR